MPRDWPSGFYAAHLVNEAGEDFLPFIVRPARPQSNVVLLVPTFSYQLYGCNCSGPHHWRTGAAAGLRASAMAWKADVPLRRPVAITELAAA